MSRNGEVNPFQPPATQTDLNSDSIVDSNPKPGPKNRSNMSTFSSLLGVGACVMLFLDLQIAIFPAIGAVITGSRALSIIQPGRGLEKRNAKVGIAIEIIASIGYCILPSLLDDAEIIPE